MTDTTNSADMLDVRDLIERFEELEGEREALDEDKAALEDWDGDNGNELEELKELLEELCGRGGDHQWKGDWYPVTLIRDSYFVDAMQELVKETGDMPKGFPAYLEIDWDATARNLQQDYTSVEYGDVTYWYR